MKMAVFWVAIALMTEEASTSETAVNFYQTTRRTNPEDSHLHTRRRENLKSQIMFSVCAEWRVLYVCSIIFKNVSVDGKKTLWPVNLLRPFLTPLRTC
jgi:hypothetical protein